MSTSVITGIGRVERSPSAGEDWFNVADELGRRGYKYLPPGCHYLLAATRRAIAGNEGFETTTAERRGLAVGCHSVLAPLYREVAQAVLAGDSSGISPMTAPFFAINALAGRLAEERRIKGFTLTTTSPRVAGLEALEVGTRALAAGRCAVLLAGVTEQLGSDAGAVAMVIEDRDAVVARGAVIHGECRTRTGFVPAALAATADGPMVVAAELRGLAGSLGVRTPLPTHLVLDGSAVGLAAAAAARGLGRCVLVDGADQGCLTAMSLVADLIADGGEHLVVSATDTGNLALAHIRPGVDNRG